MPKLPARKNLHHDVPAWVDDGSLYFVTICTRPRGLNRLCVAGVGERLVASAAHCHERQRWWLKLFLLMPDHVHALLAVPRVESLPKVIRAWKSYQARMLGIDWQPGFFDHRLRSDESADEKALYIRRNPVRAGLAPCDEDWPYRWPMG